MRSPNMNPFRRTAFALVFCGLISSLALPFANASHAARARTVGATNPLDQNAAGKQEAPALLTPEQARTAYGKIGMSFEANQGQTNDAVKFFARGAGYTLFLTQAEAVFVLAYKGGDGAASRREQLLKGDVDETALEAASSEPPAVLRMRLEGASSQPVVSGLDELEGRVNYFIGNDPDQWHTDIPTFGRVHYSSVYKGVDMVYYGNQQQLEYDFVVRPGADYKQIALGFEGASKVEVDAASGDLLLQVGERTLRQQKPSVYQEVNGERKEVASGYLQKGAGRIGFAVGAYDAQRPLIIDPVLAYSTYLGGSDFDDSTAVAVDASGNAYVTGETPSTNFPTVNAIQSVKGASFDAYITKLNASGSTLVYSTYLGGASQEIGRSIVVDASGNAYVGGGTSSSDFPTTAGAFDTTPGGSDGFVTKLNASGSALVYSTFLGGRFSDSCRGVAIDASGNAYTTGSTQSPDFPTTAGAFDTTYNTNEDAFVSQLNATGSALIYSTYLGGSDFDQAFGIAIDSFGSAYITGRTGPLSAPGANNFPTTAGAFDTTYNGGGDAFVTKLNATGSALVYSTFLGGTGEEPGLSDGPHIAVDASGNAYVTGGTSSAGGDFPTTVNAVQSLYGGMGDAFVTKFNAAGSALVYSTFLGGLLADKGAGVALDASGNAYVTGTTASPDFPTTAGAFDTTFNTNPDAFMTKINAPGTALVYSTFLGGSGADGGTGIAVDTSGNTYVSGFTNSTNFPTTTNAIQSTPGGDYEAFVAKIGDYSISGRVIDSSGNSISGVTVTLSGTNSAMTTTDGNGNFAFLNTTLDGNFTVTTAKAGFTFSPPSITVNDLTTNQELIFVGTSTTPTSAQARVQFEFAQYIAAEDCGSLSVAITRTGDTTTALTVDFATSDGTAKQKGDYGITLGTLSFAPGETSKTVTLLITEDAFVEGDETFNLNLFNVSGLATLVEPSRATITIADDDTAQTNTNPIDDSQTFVCQHYHDFLNRQPDPSGLLFWVNNIESCGANASCREAKRIDTSAAFFLSIEFQATGFYAIRLQRAAFGKRSDTATTRMIYQDLARDTRQLGDGVIVGQAGADAKLEQNKQAYATQVVTSAAFIARFPTSQTAAQYVDAVFASAQITPTATERANAITSFGGGGTAGRVAALRNIVESQSIINAEVSPAFVLLQYHGYLRRNPTDLPDANDSGYQFWLAKLNSFGGDFRKAEMVKAFIASSEYRQRFGQQ